MKPTKKQTKKIIKSSDPRLSVLPKVFKCKNGKHNYMKGEKTEMHNSNFGSYQITLHIFCTKCEDVKSEIIQRFE